MEDAGNQEDRAYGVVLPISWHWKAHWQGEQSFTHCRGEEGALGADGEGELFQAVLLLCQPVVGGLEG